MPGVDPAAAAGGLTGFSFFLRGTGMGGPPGVPGKGCLRGRPRPRCGVGPGVTPGVPGVPGVPGALAAAAAAAALALLLLGGLDGVAAAVDGVPGIDATAGEKGPVVEAPADAMPGSIGTPLVPTAADMDANDGAELCCVPGTKPYIIGGPNWAEGAEAFGPGGGMDMLGA